MRTISRRSRKATANSNHAVEWLLRIMLKLAPSAPSTGVFQAIRNHVQVGHDTQIGANCLVGAHTAIAGVTRIEDDVIIWAKVAINKDLVIGKGAVILATSAVDKSLPGGITYFGSPAIEARKKWKELVMLRKLPEIYKKLK
jgi:UDP-3-O-[3-hydroxymyristoyl] glucosamine N-acyltransferase